MHNMIRTALALLAIGLTILPSTAGVAARVFYENIPGNSVADLKGAAHFPEGPINPSGLPLFIEVLTDQLAKDDTPELGAEDYDNYGSCIRGYIDPPLTGTYTFYIRSDDGSELLLSTDHAAANAQVLAFESGCCTPLFSGDRIEERSSDPIQLEFGTRYYYEVLHKEGIGAAYIEVGWKRPDGVQQIIPADYLLPLPLTRNASNHLVPASSVAPEILAKFAEIPIPNSGQPAAATATESLPVSFAVTVQASAPVTFQWLRNGEPVPNSNSQVLTLKPSRIDTGSSFSVIVSNQFGVVTSAAATLIVTPDNTAPTIASVRPRSSNPNIVDISFSEEVSASTATETSNFTINNGVTVQSITLAPNGRSATLVASGIQDGVTDYQLTISNVADLAGNPVATTQIPLAIFPVFQEVDGVVAIEAEHFTANVPQGEHQWQLVNTPAGFSGDGTLYASPNEPVAVIEHPNFLTLSPRLDYTVNFAAPGTYYVWVRGSDGGGDSIHAGLNGESPNTTVRTIDSPGCCGTRAVGVGTDLVWINGINDTLEGRARIEVPTAGLHTFNLWMREDGMIVDKVVLTTDLNLAVTGQGPTEVISDFAFPNARIEISQQPQAISVTERGTATFSVDAKAFSADTELPLASILYQWLRDGTEIPGATSSTLTVGPVSVTDDEQKFQVLLRVPGARVLSQEATLNVNSDVAPPTVISAEANGTLDKVTLVFSEGLTAETANNIANYTITSGANTVAVQNAELLSDSATVLLTTDALTLGTEYTVAIQNLTDVANPPNPVAANTTIKFKALGPFNQNALGTVVIEAEHFDNNVPQGGHEWVFHSDVAGPFAADLASGYSGDGAMYSLPESGVNRSDASQVPSASPRLDYAINFRQTGIHYVWFRGSDGGGNSTHIGIDGVLPSTGVRFDRGCCGGGNPGGQTWVWVSELNSSALDSTGTDNRRARFEVASTGVHLFNIWMREDGTLVDKFIITTDPNFTPSGAGPIESKRVGEPQFPIATITAPTADTTLAVGSEIIITADAADEDGSVTLVEFFANGKKIGEDASAPFSTNWRPTVEAAYLLRAQATDDDGQSFLSPAVRVVYGNPPRALFIGNNPPADAGDAAAIQRLETRFNFVVTAVDDDAVIVTDADGVALVVISSTVSSGDVNVQFTGVPIPIINWEEALFDDLNMTGDSGSAPDHHGTTGAQTDVTILLADHPLAAGLAAGTHTVMSSPQTFSWGNPVLNEANTIQVATVGNRSDQFAVFAYEKDAPLYDPFHATAITLAPERRVGFFLNAASTTALNDAGWALFDAAVAWAIDIEVPADDEPPILTIVEDTNTVTISWAGGAGFRLQQSTGLTTPAWSDVPNGGQSPVTVTIEGETKFFRLLKE